MASNFFRTVLLPSQSPGLYNVYSMLQGDIQTRVDEQLSTSQTGRQAEDTVDENAPPEMPDPKVSAVLWYH